MQNSTSPPPPSPETPATPTADSPGDAENGASTATALAPTTDSPTELQHLPSSQSDGFAETVPFRALDLRINRSVGEFKLDGDPTPRSQVILVPKGCNRAQTYYGLPYKPGEPHNPSCQSPDGKLGHGWVDVRDQTDRTRKCAGCIRKGFGAGYCTDLMVMMAYDIERDAPILTRFQNAEINPRKGVFTLAVNRFRSMGLTPTETALTLSFTPGAGQYQELVIDVAPYKLPQDTLDMLEVCWAAYTEGLNYEVQELLALYEADPAQ